MGKYRNNKSKNNKLLTDKNMRKVLNKVNHISKLEVQRHLLGLTLVVIPGAGLITALTAIPQGDDIDARTGRKIHATRVLMKGFVTSTEPTLNNTAVRIMIVRDSEQNGLLPIIAADVSAPNGILEVTNINSFLSMQLGSKRYKVLYDKRLMFESGVLDLGNGAKMSQLISFNKKVSFPIYYNGTTSAQADQGKNNIYLLLLASAGVLKRITARFKVEFKEI